jgi:hypothetical protein
MELLAKTCFKGNGSRIYIVWEKIMSALVSAVMMVCGGMVIGYYFGHRKGFGDGFDCAVQNSDDIAKKVMENAHMRVFKMVDGELKEVTESDSE